MTLLVISNIVLIIVVIVLFVRTKNLRKGNNNAKNAIIYMAESVGTSIETANINFAKLRGEQTSIYRLILKLLETRRTRDKQVDEAIIATLNNLLELAQKTVAIHQRVQQLENNQK